MRRTIIVSGALANKPFNGGEAWVRMSWVTGLRRLGFDVYFIEQAAAAARIHSKAEGLQLNESINRRYFSDVTQAFGLTGRCSLVITDGETFGCEGLNWETLLNLASRAELLVNISGHLTLQPLLARVRRSAYIDIDPGFTQFWHDDPTSAFRISKHDVYFTIGENIGSPACPIPTAGIHWCPVRQPVVLDDWPVVGVNHRRFTTVASWRGAFGPVLAGGRSYGVKVHEFRKVLALPRHVATGPADSPTTFEIALDIHPADARDSHALADAGWRITDPRLAAGTPESFRQYVQQSAAEFSVAQGIYVDTNSGWFSDRTIRYLASGKPVLVQDTGFNKHLPIGKGLVPFRTLDEAVDGAQRIMADYPGHCRAARDVAESCFESNRVLTKFLSDAGVEP